jgi:four helix bundle protein
MTTFDLEDRMTRFAKNVCDFLRPIPLTEANTIYMRQLLRSSSSIGANYLEANDALGKKDFLVKTRTSRREGKETRYWLRLLEIPDNQKLENKRKILIDEAEQLIRILSAIINKVQQSAKG